MIKDLRLAALRRFAVAISLLNIAGHLFLGFEQSVAQVLASLATAYSTELLLEAIDARAHRRQPRFLGGPKVLINFLLPAHITGLAVAMLLYANQRILPVVFGAIVAIGSKAILRVPLGTGTRHFLNPSNAGIATTLLLFPWVGIAPPYQFSEQLTGVGHIILHCVFIFTGSFLNDRLTGRIPLISGWLGGFFLQALIRNSIFGTSWESGLVPMTGIAFLLFTFYMISDPGTTPFKPKAQILFGASVAFVYGVLMILHVSFGLFFALAIVCIVRGAGIWVIALARSGARVRLEGSQEPEPAPVLLREAGL